MTDPAWPEVDAAAVQIADKIVPAFRSRSKTGHSYSCHGFKAKEWSAAYLAAKAALAVPAPLPFPARQDSPDPDPEVAAAWGDLLQGMVGTHSALDDLETAVDAMLPDAPTVAGLRAAADAAAVLADRASSLSRAIHDAFPDVVAACPVCAVTGRCGNC